MKREVGHSWWLVSAFSDYLYCLGSYAQSCIAIILQSYRANPLMVNSEVGQVILGKCSVSRRAGFGRVDIE